MSSRTALAFAALAFTGAAAVTLGAASPASAAPALGVTAPAASVAVSAPAASTPGVPTRTISRATVARHASARSCWTVVNGTVYDLTGWVSRHPGGRGAVLSMCGRDGSAAFNAQHGSAGAASSSLRTYAIGRAVR